MKTKRRTFWVPDNLWKKMAEAASKDGRTISGWIRKVVVIAIDDAKKD